MVVTAGVDERFIVLDGHVRVRVLRALGRDDVDAVLLELPEAEALVVSHRLDNTRTRSALEEGWMLRVLVEEHGLRQSDVAAKLYRSESWVTRRLGLVRMRPASVQKAVQEGRGAAQAAQKWLLPLSRDNREQCVRLVENLGRRGATGDVPGSVEILGGGLITPRGILGAFNDKDRREEECQEEPEERSLQPGAPGPSAHSSAA